MSGRRRAGAQPPYFGCYEGGMHRIPFSEHRQECRWHDFGTDDTEVVPPGNKVFAGRG